MRCFSSPGSLALPIYSAKHDPKGPGFPIRKFTDQSLLAAPRDLSQRATSFIASVRLGIHQMLLRHLISRDQLSGPQKANPNAKTPKHSTRKDNNENNIAILTSSDYFRPKQEYPQSTAQNPCPGHIPVRQNSFQIHNIKEPTGTADAAKAKDSAQFLFHR